MSTAAQVLAIAIAVMLGSVWLMESFFYRHPRLYPMFLLERRDFDAVRLWIVNLGFYNLTTGIALALGVVLARTGHVPQVRRWSRSPPGSTSSWRSCCSQRSGDSG